MKKYFPKILILIVVTGMFIPQLSIASPQNPNEACRYDTVNGERVATNEPCQPLFNESGEVNEKVTSGTSIVSILADSVAWIPGAISIGILQIAHLLVWLAGAILNYVVVYSVVDMKENIDKANVVNDAWKVIRDVSNIGFIFVLLYAAIETILGIGKENQKLIVKIVTVAILINFSLFFTKFVIDTSNIIAMTFYDAIAPGALDESVNRGISTSLMAPLHLQSIMDTTSKLDGTRLLIIGVMGTIFSLIAAFVFLAIAILFIIRFVVLIFVLILSPIAFVSFVLPKMEKYRTQWWDALSGQAFFAPIYFLMTWIVIMVSRNMLPQNGSIGAGIAGGIGPSGEAIPPQMSDIGMIVNFLIIIALLITSLIISKEWSNKTGHGIGKLTDWATGRAGAATFGMVGRAGRQTLGRAGVAIANNKDLRTAAAAGGVGGMTARLALWSGKKASKSTYDARNTGVGGAVGGMVGAGSGIKGGRADMLKAKKDTEKEEEKAERPGIIKAHVDAGRFNDAYDEMTKMTGPELNDLDDSILHNPHILDLYQPRILNKMARADIPEPKARPIRAHITADPAHVSHTWIMGAGATIF